MVITKLFGGLGNQMFQYACGRALSLKNKSELKLDLSFFENQSFREYGLHHFPVVENIAGAREIDRLRKRHNAKLNKLKRRLFNAKPYFVHEKDLESNPNYLKTQHDVYIDGYWQSEKYFTDFSAQIKKDFRVKTPPSSENKNMLAVIESCRAISLHIRRGDIAIKGPLNEIHGTCSMDYYQKAADLIASETSNPVFFIFSDDILWARQHLNLNHSTRFVGINDGHSAFEDLRLMYHCDHHIIANSTFSWWGAWLNDKSGKITVAPEVWFADTELNRQSASIIPSNWIRI